MIAYLRHSALLKVLALLLLMLLLCIPLGEIRSLIYERGHSQEEAAQELASTYTGAQTVVGPLLVVPYVERWKEMQRDEKGRATGVADRSAERVHLVFPDTLDLEGAMTPQERYRGIFKIPFYTLKGALKGRFGAFDPASIPHEERGSTIEAKTPYILFNTSDLRGLEGTPALDIAGERLPFMQRAPGMNEKAWLASGIHAPLAGAALAAWRGGQPVDYALQIALVGQERLSVAPIAGETTAHLQSPWASPSFGGRFLAAQREITDQGFDAHWRVSSLVTGARDQVRAGVQARNDRDGDLARLETFDVSLVQPLNVYSMSTRAAKYGAMFIGLVLMATFMFELFRKLRLHPVQYALVGLSIALFFLLLVALSEKLLFWQAYGLAALASVLLLAAYFSAVLKGWGRGLSLGGFVAVLYAALYGLLASENDSLLLGSLLVFGMLATLMLATRKVDWYALAGEAAAGVKAGKPAPQAVPQAAPQSESQAPGTSA